MRSRIYYSEYLINDGFTLKLDAASVSLIEDDIADLVRFLHQHPEIKALDLSGQPLSHASIEALAGMLRVNRGLRSLSLSHTGIDCTDLSLLAEALEENAGLRTLNLSGNQIKDKGVSALADLLYVYKNLVIVVLSHNYLSDHAVCNLVHAFYKNEAILRVDLSHQFGQDNVAVLERSGRVDISIYESLPVSGDLDGIDLSLPPINHDGDVIQPVLMQHPAEFYQLNIAEYHAHHALLLNGGVAPSAPEVREEQKDAHDNHVKRSNS